MADSVEEFLSGLSAGLIPSLDQCGDLAGAGVGRRYIRAPFPPAYDLVDLFDLSLLGRLIGNSEIRRLIICETMLDNRLRGCLRDPLYLDRAPCRRFGHA